MEREKYPLYRRELKNDENIRSLRRMLIKKRWFESSESFGERVRELRKRKEQLRRKYRYEAQVIQSAIDKISEKQEAERRRPKNFGEKVRRFLETDYLCKMDGKRRFLAVGNRSDNGRIH